MRYTLYKNEDYKTGQWMGGTTTELAIFPKTSKYLDRDFVWRLSSATIETDESDFSRLPDYDRVLMVLEGEVVLSYENQHVARLKELEQDRFDGQWKTRSFGKIKDFNLMVRKGSEGYLDVIVPESDAKNFTSTEETYKSMKTHALYCRDGYAVVGAGANSHMLSAGNLLVLEYDEDEEPSYTIMGEGHVIRAQIFYDDMSGEVAPEIIPSEKTTFDDFKQCIFLANVQFRWAEHIVKKLKTIWFDEALSSAIEKLEKCYATTIAFLIGAVVIGAFTANSGASDSMIVLSILIWLLVDCLIVSPLIYLPFMPKPIKKHIKDIDKLTPYERRKRDEQLGKNPGLEKLMKKYEKSGKNLGN